MTKVNQQEQQLTPFEQDLYTNTLLQSLTAQRDQAMNDVTRLSGNVALLNHRLATSTSECEAFRDMLPKMAGMQKEQLDQAKAERDAIIAVRDDEITRLKQQLAIATGIPTSLTEEESLAAEDASPAGTVG
jgi:LPS O-antigen subunit length determinant protein (WzzB/FepE family)